MNLHKTIQYIPGGDYNKFYSLLPPAVNNDGSALIVMVNSLGLRGTDDGKEITGIKDERVLLMGNSQIINSEPVQIWEFLNEFPRLDQDERELVQNLLEKQLQLLEQDLNKSK